jgi:hypothetical protein
VVSVEILQPGSVIAMSRQIGERYHCPKCGAQLVYEKPCPCPAGSGHAEICCGEQMQRLKADAAAG